MHFGINMLDLILQDQAARYSTGSKRRGKTLARRKSINAKLALEAAIQRIS
jgi:hypothetical protein